jgi:autoinducer 2 (AI-2) kinase
VTADTLLAIDAGTGSGRAVLFSADGSQIAIAQREYSHAEIPDVPGSQVFDTARNWRLICECVHEVLASSGVPAEAVRAVSATSMREGMVLYDARGHELWACPNVDARARVQAEELVRSGIAQEIYDRSGDWVAITAPARFLWLAHHEPEVFSAIAHVGMLGDWIVTRLSGEFATDASLGSSSGMFELAERRWSDRVLELCGLDRSVFPAVVDSGTVVGGVTAQAAAETGLRAGTPVVAGGADTQLALLGIGVAEPGRFTVVGGSFWQSTVVLGEPLVDPLGRLRTLCHTVPGEWMMEGIGFYCGLAMRWFRDAFCDAETAEAGSVGRDVYELLEERAASVPPGSRGLFAILSNLMTARSWVHAAPALIGFDIGDPQRSGKRECVRAIEEAAAYVACGHLRIASELAGCELRDLVFTGGAAKGSLWPQIVADVTGVPVTIPAVKESSALGAAIYAGVGAGLYATTADVPARFERTVEPRADAHATYRLLYAQWLELYQRALELTDTGIVRPLWRAAGT